MLFDSHAHLDDERFDEDREKIIAGFEEAGLAYVLNPGCDRKTSQKAYQLARDHDRILAAVGNHPHEARHLTQADLDYYKDLAGDEKVVAIGEIGLDFYYDHSPRDVQIEAFHLQMDLAQDLGLPVLIHMREASQETYQVLKAYQGRVRGVMHCYSEDWDWAKKFLDLGFYLALGGMVTFKKAQATREVAKEVPLDRLMVETDCPYLTPEPHRGKRNEPKYVGYVVEMIAQIRDLDYDYLAQRTYENTMELLGL